MFFYFSFVICYAMYSWEWLNLNKKLVDKIENIFSIISVIVLIFGVGFGIINIFNINYQKYEYDPFGFSNLFVNPIIGIDNFFSGLIAFFYPIFISVLIIGIFYAIHFIILYFLKKKI